MIKVDCGLAPTGEPIPQDPESLAAITTGARTQTGFIKFFQKLKRKSWSYLPLKREIMSSSQSGCGAVSGRSFLFETITSYFL
jgi:hypothetical protein